MDASFQSRDLLRTWKGKGQNGLEEVVGSGLWETLGKGGYPVKADTLLAVQRSQCGLGGSERRERKRQLARNDRPGNKAGGSKGSPGCKMASGDRDGPDTPEPR